MLLARSESKLPGVAAASSWMCDCGAESSEPKAVPASRKVRKHEVQVTIKT